MRATILLALSVFSVLAGVTGRLAPSLPLAAASARQQRDPWRLGALERDAGWVVLFDGTSTDGWRGYGLDGFPARGWEIRDGCLHRVVDEPSSAAGDLVTRALYDELELELEWKIAPGGNSGIKYRVVERDDRPSALGPEYQVCDDGAPGIDRPEHSCGALYALHAPSPEKPALALGEFHTTRIVVRDERIEHWLDDVRVVDATIGDADWERRIAASKFAGVERFGREPGHIVLQDHGSEVWFRRIRVRDLSHPPGTPVALHDGATLAGWRALGDARWTSDPGGIVGESGGGAHSFLVTEREYGDFLLEVDVKTEAPGNSGIQVRSRVDGERVRGYQIEIDPSERAWSGGLYEEGGRGWLDDLEGDDAARAAFRPGDWNRFRIECVGPSIRAWVNGITTADFLDAEALSGVIALQVHSGSTTRVRWRDFRMWSLGTRSWVPCIGGDSLEGWETSVEPPQSMNHAGSQWRLEAGILVAEPSAGQTAVALRTVRSSRELAVRMRIENARGTLRIDLEDARFTGGAGLNEELGFSVPLDRGDRSTDLTLLVYGPRVALDVDGRRLYEIDGPVGFAEGPVAIRWFELAQPARVLALDVLGPLEQR